MLAYHGRQDLKDATILAMSEDIQAQRLVRGQYWKNGKGCFVGCVIRGDDHRKFETVIGFPEMLAHLADTLFEGLPTQEDRDKFAIDYLAAPKAGADLKLIGWKFQHWILTEGLKIEGKGKIFNKVRKAIKQCADVLVPLMKGEPVDKKAAGTAAEAARAAAEAAAEAAGTAAWAAWAAAEAAGTAAWAAWAAEEVAEAAAWAAEAAGTAAWAAWAAEAAAEAAEAAGTAEGATYPRMAKKLIELMRGV